MSKEYVILFYYSHVLTANFYAQNMYHSVFTETDIANLNNLEILKEHNNLFTSFRRKCPDNAKEIL